MLQFQNRQLRLPNGAPVIVSQILGAIEGSSVRQFEKKMLEFLQQGVPYLVIDFSQVTLLNSTGMGILVKLNDLYQEAGGAMSLVGVPDRVAALFRMLGLTSIVELSHSEEEALQNFYTQRRR